MRLRFPVALLGILSLSILLLVGCQHLFSSYHVVNNFKSLSEEVRFWAEAYNRIFVGTSMTDDKYTYVLVSTGPAADPKQTVNILGIKEEDDAIYVEVDLASEVDDTLQPGEHYNYPFVLARIRKTALPVKFRSAVNPELWIPQVVGAPDGWLPFWGPEGTAAYSKACPQIVLGAIPPKPGAGQAKPNALTVEGLARVFEATVEQDWLADGGPYGHSYTMAASGAPDWGFFRFELEIQYGRDLALRIYNTSAKDGSIENLVTITSK